MIKSYNPATKSFHRHNVTILCTLDYVSFIEAFGLEGVMSELVNLIDLQVKFERNTKDYIGKCMIQKIPMDLKRVEYYPNKIEKKIPLDKFKKYFVKIVYGVHKVVEKYGSDLVYGVEYSMTKDVYDSYHGGEYGYVEYILENM